MIKKYILLRASDALSAPCLATTIMGGFERFGVSVSYDFCVDAQLSEAV